MTNDEPDEVTIIPWAGGLGVNYRRGSQHNAHTGIGSEDWPLIDRAERAGKLKFRGDVRELFRLAKERRP